MQALLCTDEIQLDTIFDKLEAVEGKYHVM